MSVFQNYRSFPNNISFDPARQSAELMKILETETKIHVPHLAESILTGIENGDHARCGILCKDTIPLAAVMYSQINTNQQNKIGLCIQNIILFRSADKVGKKGVFEAVIDKVTHTARDLQAEYILTYSTKDSDEYTFLKNKKFSEIKIESQNPDSESAEISMILQMGESIEKKRKQKKTTQKTQIIKAPRTTNQNNHPINVLIKNVSIQQIKSGEKTIEARINKGIFHITCEGDLFRFHNQGNSDAVICKVTKIHQYISFQEMLKSEGYKKCFPEAESLALATFPLSKYAEQAVRFGVLALHIEKIDQ